MIRCLCTILLLCGSAPLAAQTAVPDVTVLERAAEDGDLSAQLALAAAYHQGNGMVQNYARAAEIYARAAEAGDATAQNAIGRYYHAGLGVAVDTENALRWLKAAADQGDPLHIYDYASAVENTDPAQAAALYERASAAGHLKAAVSLGVLYQHGTGIPQDFEKARALYQTAADAGDARAQNNLGLLFVRGDGVEQDYARAAALFSASAKQGLRPAMTNLGVMYANGFGVSQSDTEAARLTRLGAGVDDSDPQQQTGESFLYDSRLNPPNPATSGSIEQAAMAGDPLAQFQFAYLLVTSPDLNHAGWRRAAALFRSGAKKGHPPAMVNLAQLYVTGRGVPQDYVLAQMWLLRARAAGLQDAEAIGVDLQGRMTAAQINDAQARAALISGDYESKL